MSAPREESGPHAAPQATRDGSISTSIKELIRLEEQRQCKEEEEARRRGEAERAAREARERRAREAEEAEKKRALEERERELRRAREESARVEGMRASMLEKARVAAESRVRVAEDERRQAHEVELARIHSTGVHRYVALGVLMGAALSMTLAAIGYLGVIRPQMARANESTLRALEDRRTLRDELDTALAGERTKVLTLSSELATARETNTQLARALDAARHGQPAPETAPHGTLHDKGSTPRTEPAHAPCRKGDPICENLGP